MTQNEVSGDVSAMVGVTPYSKVVVNVKKSMLAQFDELVGDSEYVDRSEYVRALMRAAIAKKPIGEVDEPSRLSPEGICALCERGEHRSCLHGLGNLDGTTIECKCQDRRHATSRRS